MMEGGYIEIGRDGGGFRDFLDGRPIHCGDQLHLRIADRWIYARYEVADYHKREVDLYCVDAIIPLNRATMQFRWPPCEQVNLCWRGKRHSVHQSQSPK